jgi:hypothetical protein
MIKNIFHFGLYALYIYLSILVTWAIYGLFAHFVLNFKTIDPEGIAGLLSLIVPINTICSLVLIYTLSILDRSILTPRFIISAAVFAEISYLVIHHHTLFFC